MFEAIEIMLQVWFGELVDFLKDDATFYRWYDSASIDYSKLIDLHLFFFELYLFMDKLYIIDYWSFTLFVQ